MSILVFLVYLIPVALIAVTALVVIMSSTRYHPDGQLESVRRRAMVFTVAAAALALVTFFVVVNVPGPRPSVRLAIAPLVAGGAMVLVCLVNELSWPQPVTPVRSASLERRSWSGIAPGWLVALGAVGTLSVWVIDIFGTLTASPDGRSYTTVGASEVHVHGPYPGSYYAFPTFVASVLVLVLTVVALVIVDRRAGVGTSAYDTALRRLSAHRVLRGAVFGELATAAGLAYFGGIGLAGSGAQPMTAVGVTAMIVSAGLALAALVAVALPSGAMAGMQPAPAYPPGPRETVVPS